MQISVITPAFRPQSFEDLQASMAGNEGPEIEWIVVDDGSGSAYDAVFEALPDSVRVIRMAENRRQGAARNTGVAEAQGVWIKFLDADDRLDAGHLDALLQAAKPDTKAIPFAQTKHVFSGGGTMVNTTWRDLASTPEAQFERLLIKPFLHHGGALFPRDLVQRLGGYDEALITDEDGDLLLRVLQEGYHFEPVEGVHYLYTHHETGPRVSADDDITKMEARVRTCDKVLACYDQAPPTPVAVALAQRMDKIAMTYWSSYPSEARALEARAQALSPQSRAALRPSLRLVRLLGGPGLVFTLQSLYRRVRGLPPGGKQG